MCGIAGFLGRSGGADAAQIGRAMADAIAHRGPDASGVWVDPAGPLALSHRRLSILDLSPDGAQPMTSHGGRYVMVFNGEAYNFAPLRDELAAAGYAFRGHSDTEVLLAAFERWGVAASIPKFAGMFALAVWDRETRTLTLARDRLGEKPLYYGRVGDAWVFGSELKALAQFPAWNPRVDPTAVAQLLRHGYIQGPTSIYEGVAKVRPGTLVVLRASGDPSESAYWDAAAAARAGLANPFVGTVDDAATALDAVLRPIVRDEMVADVPLGAFLSGGIDSSLIVALMQDQSARPIRTFTIGVDDPAMNEAPFAAAVARHLGTDHTELQVRGDDALEFVADLHTLYDEPMADSSQLPTLLVSRLTRQHVTVALSGDGGDELFGGYQHHRFTGRTSALRARTPQLVRGLLGPALLRLPDPPPDALARLITDGDRAPGDRPANAVSRLGAMFVSRDDRQLHGVQLALTTQPSRLLNGTLRDAAGTGEQHGPWVPEGGPFAARMFFDAVSYLPDDILVKVDRAAMAFSLETRAPLLDHRVFEFAWRVPYHLKVRDGVGKLPLRQLLYRYVPRSLVERPKRGFSIPLAAWLRGPLRPWAEELLTPAGLAQDGVLAARPVRRLWDQHVRGIANHSYLLWAILSLTAFLRANRASASLQRSA